MLLTRWGEGQSKVGYGTSVSMVVDGFFEARCPLSTPIKARITVGGLIVDRTGFVVQRVADRCRRRRV